MRKFNSVFVIICLVLFNSISVINAQENQQVQKYNGISNSNKKIIYSDDFKNSNSNWKTDNSYSGNIKLEQGNLLLESYKGKYTAIQTIEINENEDFQIETELKYLSGNTKRAFGIQWGRSEKGDHFFSFMINSAKQFAISKFSGAYINYKQERSSALIKPNEYNKITIRKINNFIYFFLNENLVYNMEYKLGYGKQIALLTTGENKVYVKYINVYSINNSIKNNPPEITLIEPELDNTFANIDGESGKITIKGFVKDESIINTITVNNKEYPVNTNGYFKIYFDYSKETGNIKLSAKDNQLLATEEYINLKRSVKTNNPNNTSNSFNEESKYYALIIGVDNYSNPSVHSLNGPIRDAERLKEILTDYYTFDEENITFLKNPTRQKLIIAFDNLGNELTENDNLLIFYAGHGYWDFDRKTGYWLPSDASIDNTANWFRNSTIKSYVASLETKNLLLIADACFSGGIFRTRGIFKEAPTGIEELYTLPSRKAMTSGNLKEVPDESQFIKFLTQKLIDNQEKFITSEKLFNSFKEEVINNTENTPQFGTIKNSGDQGGDFIFIRK